MFTFKPPFVIPYQMVGQILKNKNCLNYFLYIYVLFWYANIKIIFKNKKNIILIYFQVKYNLKNNRYYIFKLFLKDENNNLKNNFILYFIYHLTNKKFKYLYFIYWILNIYLDIHYLNHIVWASLIIFIS
jgi:hypothetical protein